MAKAKPTTPTRHRKGPQKPLKKKAKKQSPAAKKRKLQNDKDYAMHMATPSIKSSLRTLKENEARPVNRAARNITKKTKYTRQYD